MNMITISPEHLFSGHCTAGGSNKVWSACLAIEHDEGVAAPLLTEASDVIYLCVYGPHGGNLRIEAPQRLAREAAIKLFQKKCQEKRGKGYQAVPFPPFLESFGRPCGLTLVLSSPKGVQAEARVLSDLSSQQMMVQEQPLFRYAAAGVKPLTREQLQARSMELGFSGLTEKVNGERCLLEFDGEQLRAYNRKGRLMSAPPEGARALCQCGCPFVVDGERLTGSLAGTYVLFDVLEWNGEPVIDLPFSDRLQRALTHMLRAGLLKEARCTPTFRQAQANSSVPDLAVLVPITGPSDMQALSETVRSAGGEGIICRNLSGRYQDGAMKYKFLDDIDAFVFGIQEGLAGGSLKLGVMRPADQAMIDIGHVRSGLSDQDMQVIRCWVEEGVFPVFTVQYLPARTVSLHLVEPRTSLSLLRTDKDPWDCTTDQFGPEKAELIRQAPPVMDMTLPEPEGQAVYKDANQTERGRNAVQL